MLIDCDGRGAAAGRQHRVFVMLAHLCTSVTALTMTDADADDAATRSTYSTHSRQQAGCACTSRPA